MTATALTEAFEEVFEGTSTKWAFMDGSSLLKRQEKAPEGNNDTTVVVDNAASNENENDYLTFGWPPNTISRVSLTIT